MKLGSLRSIIVGDLSESLEFHTAGHTEEKQGGLEIQAL